MVLCCAVLLMSLVSSNAESQVSCVGSQAEPESRGAVVRAFAEFGARLLAVGRVDSVSADRGVEILGRFVQPNAGETYQVGDYAAIVDWSIKASRARILEVRSITARYVPGASEVYLRAPVQATDATQGRMRAGKIDVDYSATGVSLEAALSLPGSVIAVQGTQPAPRGVVLGSCISLARDLSYSRRGNSPDGSLGTGKPDGSLGTG